jgi:two-component system CheB/CheR fusion protein
VTLQESAAEPVRSSRAKKGHARTQQQEQQQKQKQKRQDKRTVELEREMQTLRETLLNTIEEANTTSEELRSSNEELQSTNEEMQSANEELETAKEEMQSLNEELQTVNNELLSKVASLSQTTDDMQNLLNSTQIATLFLDSELRIKRFTSQATRVIKLIPSDVGRPISDLVINLDYERLEADAQQVLRTLLSKETQTTGSDGTWYLVRILPYRTAENMVDGLVITCINISNQKRAEAKNEAFLVESSPKTV